VPMAVERWLYERIDKGENIDPSIDRILRRANPLPLPAFSSMSRNIARICLPVCSSRSSRTG